MKYKRKYKKGGKLKYQTGGLFDPPLFNFGSNPMQPVPTGPGKVIMPGSSRRFGTLGSYSPPNPSGYNPAAKGTFKTSSGRPIQPKMSTSPTRLKSGRPVSVGGGTPTTSLASKVLRGLGRVATPLGLGYMVGEGIQHLIEGDDGRGENEAFLNKLRQSVGAGEVNESNVPGDISGSNYIGGLGPVAPQRQRPAGAPEAPKSPNVPMSRPEDEIIGADIDTTGFGSPEDGGINPWMGADNPVATQDLPGMDIPQGELTAVDLGEDVPSSISEAAMPGGGKGGIGADLLQFAPDIMNFATGVFGKDKTKPATRVSRRGVGMIDDRVNVRPQLMAARRNYRAIIADPNASPNQKLAAQAQLQNQESQIYADKFNRETQLKTNKARLQSQIDSQQAQFDEQFRQDKMASEANLGITGNFARQAMGNISTKMLQKKAMEAKEKGDKRDILAYISSLPEAVQTRILESYDLN